MAYVKKVKIFVAENIEDLEKQVNAFLTKETEHGFSIISLQYQTIQFQRESAYTDTVYPIEFAFTCMVYYSELLKE